MQVLKGLITAAGEPHRRIPLQTMVDRDGTVRTVLAMLVNEVAAAGIQEIGIVVPQGEEDAYARAVPDASVRLTLIPQNGTPGYAGAIWCARDFLNGHSFLHLVGDHVYVSAQGNGQAAQLVEIASTQECSVSAVQPTHESLISRFGVVAGSPVTGAPSVFKVDSVIEKPTPTQAEQKFIVSGLRAGHYLAFFGMHVLTPGFLGLLEQQVESGGAVSAALDALAARERYLAWQVTAQRYDLGPQYGLLNAQLALALTGRDRDEVLSGLVGLLASYGGRRQ